MLFGRWVSSFNLCPPCFLTITVPFTSLRDENFFRLNIIFTPAQLKSFKQYHFTSWQRTNSAQHTHKLCTVYRVQLVFGEVQLEEEEEEEEERWSGGEYGLRQVITCFTAQPNPHIWTAFNPPAFRSTLHTTFPFTSHFLNCHHLELVQMAKKWL